MNSPAKGVVSLVISTVGRPGHLARLLQSVEQAIEAPDETEVIIVDQSPGRSVATVAREPRSFPVLYIASDDTGVSRGRNLGLREVSGSVVGFPDDNCYYPPRTLGHVVRLLRQHESLEGISGMLVDDQGAPALLRWPKRHRRITRWNLIRTAISSTLFLRRRTIEQIGFFDESLGVGSGSPLGSAEETDYLFRALVAGATLGYTPSIKIVHEGEHSLKVTDLEAKGVLYGRGLGEFFRRYRYPAWYTSYILARKLAHVGVATLIGNRGEAAFNLAWARGMISGLLNRTPNSQNEASAGI